MAGTHRSLTFPGRRVAPIVRRRTRLCQRVHAACSGSAQASWRTIARTGHSTSDSRNGHRRGLHVKVKRPRRLRSGRAQTPHCTIRDRRVGPALRERSRRGSRSASHPDARSAGTPLNYWSSAPQASGGRDRVEPPPGAVGVKARSPGTPPDSSSCHRGARSPTAS